MQKTRMWDVANLEGNNVYGREEQIKKVMNSSSVYTIHCEILSHVTLRNTLWNNSL